MAEKKYIELATLFKTVEDYASTHPVMRDNELFALFCSVPAADVRPVVRGKWIKFPAALAYKNAYSSTHIVCSACEAVFDVVCNHTELFNFCPNCGAMMEES